MHANCVDRGSEAHSVASGAWIMSGTCKRTTGAIMYLKISGNLLEYGKEMENGWVV